MAEKPAAERTEQPTSKRLSKAREEGQTPQSQELLSFISILVLVTMITFLAPNLMRWFAKIIESGMSCETSVFADNQAFIGFANAKIVDSILIMSPILAALCVGGITGGIIVSGVTFSLGAIKFRFDVINPASGLSKLVNARSMVRLLLSIVKFIFVAIIAWSYLKSKIDVLATLRWVWSFQMLAVIAKIILGLMIRICIALLIIGVADTIYQKWKYIQDLKMTKQEVKEERKQTEGPPEAKKRIRRMQLEMTLRRMLQEVPKANVVLVNPTHVAVALRYEVKTMDAPVVVAKGADHLAEKIREVARAYGVPVIRRPELARAIYSTVKLNNPIPAALYVAVAEVLALIYRLRHRK
jgi:flagellar biosynthetic protein FlhB